MDGREREREREVLGVRGAGCSLAGVTGGVDGLGADCGVDAKKERMDDCFLARGWAVERLDLVVRCIVG